METGLNVLEKLIEMIEQHGMSAIMLIVLVIVIGSMAFVFLKILSFLTTQGQLHNQNYENLSTNIQKNTESVEKNTESTREMIGLNTELKDYLHKRNGTLDTQLGTLCNTLKDIQNNSKNK